MASGDDAAPAAHDEDQLQPQRNTDGAQGGTVDCAETTEITCSSTDSAQGGAVDCAGTTDRVSEDGQLGGRNPQPTRRNLTGTGGSNVTYPAQEARDENQLQPQRNIDGAQGGTVDCAETTELTCDSTDSAQGGAVDCAVTTEPTTTATPVAGSKRKRPKGKKRKMKRNKPTTNQRKKKRNEGQR
jgi:hypothetical protein